MRSWPHSGARIDELCWIDDLTCIARYDSAAFQANPAHGKLLEQIHIVARDQYGHADFVEAAENVHDFQGKVRVQVAGWLICQQQTRLMDDRAGHGCPLLLPTRNLVGVVPHVFGDAQKVHNLFDALLNRLRETVASQLMRVEIMSQPQEPEPLPMQAHHADPITGEDEVPQSMPLATPPAAKREANNPASWGKVGRNEPCPCGSGKKYKHCHGAIA